MMTKGYLVNPLLHEHFNVIENRDSEFKIIHIVADVTHEASWDATERIHQLHSEMHILM